MTNWQLIITLATLVLAIFGANGPVYALTSKRIDDLKTYLDARMETVRAEITATRAELKAEMKAQGERLERVERQIKALFVPKPR